MALRETPGAYAIKLNGSVINEFCNYGQFLTLNLHINWENLQVTAIWQYIT